MTSLHSATSASNGTEQAAKAIVAPPLSLYLLRPVSKLTAREPAGFTHPTRGDIVCFQMSESFQYASTQCLESRRPCGISARSSLPPINVGCVE